jgi:signal transduction histidine kinase
LIRRSVVKESTSLFSNQKHVLLNSIHSIHSILSVPVIVYQIVERHILNERQNMETELRAAAECARMQDELLQLRSLIGNVAHDLKTPVHSITIDLEMLRSECETLVSLVNRLSTPSTPTTCHSTLPLEQPTPKSGKHARISQAMVTAAIGRLTDQGAEPAAVQTRALEGAGLDPIGLVDSLSATCSFMQMAINRSLDFTKASSGIALVPAMETCNLKEVLEMPVSIMKHFDSAESIVLDPLPVDLCPNLITDKHWLMENVLCLLSNACKYSNRGSVRLMVSLVKDVSPPRSKEDTKEESQTDPQREETKEESQDTETGAAFNPQLPQRGNTLRVTVEDTGIGISAEARQSLFAVSL